MKDALGIVESVFQCHGEGKVIMPAKITLHFASGLGDANAMPAHVVPLGSAGIKWAAGFWGNPELGLPSVSAVIILNDPETGIPIAILEGGWITAMRTGAATGVGAKYLARKDSSVVGIVGAGFQAPFQIEALAQVFKLERVKVNDLDQQKAENLARRSESKLGIPVEAVATARRAVEESDIIVTATSSSEPIVEADWLKAGVFIAAIGSLQEVTDDVVYRMDKVLVDNLEQTTHRGALARMFQSGKIDKNRIYVELGGIVSGKKRGRISDSEDILLVPIGMGSEDMGVAGHLYGKAIKRGVGTTLPLL
jgi:alanine dehydrogenase